MEETFFAGAAGALAFLTVVALVAAAGFFATAAFFVAAFAFGATSFFATTASFSFFVDAAFTPPLGAGFFAAALAGAAFALVFGEVAAGLAF